MKSICAVLLALIMVSNLSAQFPHNFSDPPRILLGYGPQFMPSASTDVTSKNAFVDMISLSNVSGGAVTARVSDKSTNCNSGVCDIIPTVSLAANTVYIAELKGGLPFVGGINVQAGSANAIVVYIRAVRNP